MINSLEIILPNEILIIFSVVRILIQYLKWIVKWESSRDLAACFNRFVAWSKETNESPAMSNQGPARAQVAPQTSQRIVLTFQSGPGIIY